jgi:hypothetical protein
MKELSMQFKHLPQTEIESNFLNALRAVVIPLVLKGFFQAAKPLKKLIKYKFLLSTFTKFLQPPFPRAVNIPQIHKNAINATKEIDKTYNVFQIVSMS